MAIPFRLTMNEFFANFSSDYTLLWALLIVGLVGTAAIGLHFFWTAVFWVVSIVFGKPSKWPKDNH